MANKGLLEPLVSQDPMEQQGARDHGVSLVPQGLPVLRVNKGSRVHPVLLVKLEVLELQDLLDNKDHRVLQVSWDQEDHQDHLVLLDRPVNKDWLEVMVCQGLRVPAEPQDLLGPMVTQEPRVLRDLRVLWDLRVLEALRELMDSLEPEDRMDNLELKVDQAHRVQPVPQETQAQPGPQDRWDRLVLRVLEVLMVHQDS